MKKEKENTIQTIANNLVKDGNVTIQANSRDEIYSISSQLVALIPADVNWHRGCVVADGSVYYQTYSIKKVN